MARKADQTPAAKRTAKDLDVAGSRSARTRERILDATAKVLSRKGFAGMRLADIADVAQIQAPAIYYYFSSREDLIEQVMYVGIAHMRAHVETKLGQLPLDTDAITRLLCAVEAHLRFELEISDYTRAAVRNSGQVPDELRARYDAESAKYRQVWTSMIDDAQRVGLLRDDIHPRLAQMFVLGAINWTPEWWDSKRDSVDELVATTSCIVRHGIAG